MIRRWVPTLVLGGLWWWAVLRLALQPEQAGVVEGAVAAGGWGLSLLPVHVAAVGAGGALGVRGWVPVPLRGRARRRGRGRVRWRRMRGVRGRTGTARGGRGL
ncbi:hypothetical protein [Streptomyces bacillaris]|uniref:hypothetical protein n=1 Tax=Streptomyces bacillaris TaxID=68179 RepID=UPI003D753C05